MCAVYLSPGQSLFQTRLSTEDNHPCIACTEGAADDRAMQQRSGTLEYAKIDPSAEALRREVRRIVAWVTIAYASGCLATLFINHKPLLMNVGSPGLAAGMG